MYVANKREIYKAMGAQIVMKIRVDTKSEIKITGINVFCVCLQ